jgi:hypothetical protein
MRKTFWGRALGWGMSVLVVGATMTACSSPSVPEPVAPASPVPASPVPESVVPDDAVPETVVPDSELPEAPAAETVTPVAPTPENAVPDYAVPALPGFPPELDGMWCTKPDATECFYQALLVEEHPSAFVYGTSFPAEAPGATDFEICLSDDGRHSCSLAETMLLRYFPMGVEWNCTKALAIDPRWPACSPDYTYQHLTGQPRLTHMPVHQ